MFKRLAVVAPRAVGRVVSPRVSPAISSLQAQPALRLQRRGYHEKDKYFLKFRVPCQGGIGGSSMPRKMLTVPALLDHYNNPRNVGSFGKGEVDVGTGLVGAPACGDVMKLQIRVDKDTNTISDVKFKTFGCGSAIASSSYLTELVRGMTLDEAGKIRNTEIAKELCLPPVKRMFCRPPLFETHIDASKNAIDSMLITS